MPKAASMYDRPGGEGAAPKAGGKKPAAISQYQSQRPVPEESPKKVSGKKATK